MWRHSGSGHAVSMRCGPVSIPGGHRSPNGGTSPILLDHMTVPLFSSPGPDTFFEAELPSSSTPAAIRGPSDSNLYKLQMKRRQALGTTCGQPTATPREPHERESRSLPAFGVQATNLEATLGRVRGTWRRVVMVPTALVCPVANL